MKSKTAIRRIGFTLIELLVVIAIISLLVSILLPSLQNAKYLAQSVVCMNNLKGMGVATSLYTEDYDGWVLFAYDPLATGYNGEPSHRNKSFHHILVNRKYLEKGSVSCPSEPRSNYNGASGQSYGMNYRTFGFINSSTGLVPQKSDDVEAFGKSAVLFYIADSTPFDHYSSPNYTNYGDGSLIQLCVYPQDGPAVNYPVFTRHLDKANCLMFDKHVETLDSDEILEGEHWRPKQYVQGDGTVILR